MLISNITRINSKNTLKDDDSDIQERSSIISQLEKQISKDENLKTILKTRYTENNEKCQLPFVYNNKTYQDCTKDITPEGYLGQKEWCIIELTLDTNDILKSASLQSNRNIKSDSTQDIYSWGYCKEILEHNTLKKEIQNLKAETSEYIDKATQILIKDLEPGKNTLNEIRDIGKSQENLTLQLNELKKEGEFFLNKIFILEKTVKTINILTDKIKEEEYKKEIYNSEREEQQKQENKNSELETIKLNSNGTGTVSINSKFSGKFDCSGVAGYSSTDSGDGLTALYFDNELFSGYGVSKVDLNVFFDWTGTSPINDINPANFSVIWKGYLYIPITGEYYFKIESDGGVSVAINYDIVISHNIYTGVDSELLLENEVKEDTDFSSLRENPETSISKGIKLTGSVKYNFEVKYFHSTHYFLHKSNEQAFIKLYWKNEDQDFSSIDQTYFYQFLSYSELKITDYNDNSMELTKLRDNDYFFKDSLLYVIQDVPSHLELSPSLKFKTLYNEDYISFKISAPAVIYVVFPEDYAFLDNEFVDTQIKMSLLLLNNLQGKVENKKKDILAIESYQLYVYSKRYIMGDVVINIHKRGISKKINTGNLINDRDTLINQNKDFCSDINRSNSHLKLNCYGIPLMIFTKFDEKSSFPLICNESEIIASDSKGKYFRQCSSSSNKVNMSCVEGLNLVHKDQYGGMWVSNNEGVGAWLIVEFTDIFELTKLAIKNRMSLSDRSSEISLLFQKGEFQTISLPNDNKLNFYHLERVKTNSVKITITKVYESLNNGFSIAFYGNLCESSVQRQNNMSASFPSFNINFNGMKDPEIKKSEIFNKINNRYKDMLAKYSPIFFDEYRSKSSFIELNCKDSLMNSNKFVSYEFIPDKKIKVKCFHNCLIYPIKIYGGPDKYSLDSSVCKAAIHSGVIDLNDLNSDNHGINESSKAPKIQKISNIETNYTLIEITIEANDGNLKSLFKNGVKSFSKISPKYAFSLSKYKINDIINLKIGTKLEYLISNTTSTNTLENSTTLGWISAKIIKIEESKLLSQNQENKYQLTLQYTNNNLLTSSEVSYPNKHIKPCGTNIIGIDCSQSLTSLAVQKATIIFSEKCNEGLIPVDNVYFDNGLAYGTQKYPFGWSKSIVKYDENNQVIKTFNKSNPFHFDDSISKNKFKSSFEFPYHQKSKQCVIPNPIKDCEDAAWAIWTGEGLYNMKIGLSNMEYKDFYTASVVINGKQYINEDIPYKAMKEFSFDIVSDNEYFIITSECLLDCSNLALIISYVEISKLEKRKDDSWQKSLDVANIKDVGCNSFIDGKCYNTSNVENCIFAHEYVDNADKCFGDFKLIKILKNENTILNCNKIIGLKKCIRKRFNNSTECNKYCPNICKNNECQEENYD